MRVYLKEGIKTLFSSRKHSLTHGKIKTICRHSREENLFCIVQTLLVEFFEESRKVRNNPKQNTSLTKSKTVLKATPKFAEACRVRGKTSLEQQNTSKT